jgi:hypothetical protein
MMRLCVCVCVCVCDEKHTYIQQKMLSSFPIVVQVLGGRNILVHKEESTVICGNIFSLAPVCVGWRNVCAYGQESAVSVKN